MAGNIQAIRGMHDILPGQAYLWRFIENSIISILESYHYREIRLPLVEKTELFSRSIGELTDIVSKEMYTFTDRNGDQLTLRPEGTAGCVRAGIEHGLFHNQVQKLWYIGPMFRHERPQKGRQRQFHQIGIEAFGLTGPDIDAEIIFLCGRLWKVLGLTNIRLELNSLGTTAARMRYRELLVDYLNQHKKDLDEDSLRRLDNNPLRILDSKNPDLKKIISAAPQILDHLDEESSDHFAGLREILDGCEVAYTINPHLVRGLDYYGKTVFEWTTKDLGAQGTVCAGGRFDSLVEQIAGKPTPAIGCAMGLERLVELMTSDNELQHSDRPDIYFIIADEDNIAKCLKILETLRTQLPEFRVQANLGGGSLKSQFKKADKSGAMLALVLGPDEILNDNISLKPLREDSPQITLPQQAIKTELLKRLS